MAIVFESELTLKKAIVLFSLAYSLWIPTKNMPNQIKQWLSLFCIKYGSSKRYLFLNLKVL